MRAAAMAPLGLMGDGFTVGERHLFNDNADEIALTVPDLIGLYSNTSATFES
jgi:hypothetical protein